MSELGPLTSNEIERSILLVPLGATEQHGPHLPLNTDSTIALAWCRAIAERDARCVVAPTLPYGSSGEHQDFPGTLSIGAEALKLIVIELARSAKATFERIVFVSGHGGNAVPLTEAVNQLRAEGHHADLLLPIIPGSDAHAGRTETALMLHLDPDLVRTDRQAAGFEGSLADVIEQLRADGLGAVSPNGVLGNPYGANPDEGRTILQMLVSQWVTDATDC